jgi:hypothetical protein
MKVAGCENLGHKGVTAVNPCGSQGKPLTRASVRMATSITAELCLTGTYEPKSVAA